MKIKMISTFMLCVFFAINCSAQGENEKHRYFNLGIGISNWGIPVYAGLEFPIGKKKEHGNDLSMAIGGSYQSKSESYSWFGDKLTWRHTIIGVNVSVHYYFDRMIELDDDFDLYAGGGFGVYSWKTTLTESSGGFSGSYSGSGTGGIGFSYVAGARYYLNKKVALNIHYGGNTILSSARVGVSFRF
ncbi:MAG: outer membrane beta-barrel protein [Bacteroidota bacterium]